jgi:hypothetical protein
MKDVFPQEAKLLVFDNEDGGPKVFHEFGPKDHEEIDGVLVYKNIILLINGFSGEGRSELDTKHKFFERLRGIDKISQLNLKSLNGKGEVMGHEQFNLFNEYLVQNKNYDFIIKKIVMAPNIKADGSIWDNSEEDEFILDKYALKYFRYCSEINKDYSLRELLIFLSIKLPQINRLISDTDVGDPETGKYLKII